MIAQSPEAVRALNGSPVDPNWLTSFCKDSLLLAARILPANSMTPVASYGQMPATTTGKTVSAIALGTTVWKSGRSTSLRSTGGRH